MENAVKQELRQDAGIVEKAGNILELQEALTRRVGPEEAVIMLPPEAREVHELYHVEGHQMICTLFPQLSVGISNTISDSTNVQKEIEVRHDQLGVCVANKPSKVGQIIRELEDAGVIIGEHYMQFNKFLEEAVNKSNEPGSSYPTYKHTIVGWKKMGDNMVFFGEKAVGAKFDSTYAGKLNLKKCGTLAGWSDAVNQFIVDKPVSSITLAAGFTGILRQRFTGIAVDSNIVINLLAPSSSGKTTLTKGCSSSWGCPTVEDYNGTHGDRMARLAERGPMNFEIDDITQVPEIRGKARASRAQAIKAIIFDIASGKSKGRLGEYGKVQDRQPFWGAVITSSTSSLISYDQQDAGEGSRLLEISGEITSSAEEAEKMDKAFLQNFGWAAEEFASYMMKQADKIVIDRFDQIRERVRGQLITPRVATRIAIILLAGEIAKEALNLKLNLKTMESLLVESCNRKSKNFNARGTELDPDQAYEDLLKYFEKNFRYFKNGKFSSLNEKSQYLGYFMQKKTGCIEMFIPQKDESQKMELMLYKVDPKVILELENDEFTTEDIPNINSIEEILRQWKALGRLITRTSGFKIKATAVSKNKQEAGYRLSINRKLLKVNADNMQEQMSGTAA